MPKDTVGPTVGSENPVILTRGKRSGPITMGWKKLAEIMKRKIVSSDISAVPYMYGVTSCWPATVGTHLSARVTSREARESGASHQTRPVPSRWVTNHRRVPA